MPMQKKASEHGHGTHSQEHHSSHLHNPTGYTDEVAQEEHDFFDRVEREANMKSGTQSSGQQQNTRSKKGGLESSSMGGDNMRGQQSGMGQMGQSAQQKGQSMGQQAGSAMENMKNKAKDSMGMGE